MEQVYKVLINKVESGISEDIRLGRYVYLFNDRIYISADRLPEEVLPQLEEPLPEIVVNKWFGEDVDVSVLKRLAIRGLTKRGRPSKADKKKVEKQALITEVNRLAKKKMSHRKIAETVGKSKSTIQRILS